MEQFPKINGPLKSVPFDKIHEFLEQMCNAQLVRSARGPKMACPAIVYEDRIFKA